MIMRVQAFVFLIIWLLLSCSNPKQEQEQAQETEKAEKGDEINISAIELTDLEGNSVHWEELKGKKVFLNFWATWCRPCIMEMPSMDKAYQALRDENFVFLVASYEAPEKIRNFQEKQNFSFPFVHMKTNLEELNIYSIPTTFIINEEGELIKTVVGSREWDTPEMLNELKQM